jgi:hypothetical protein
MSHCRAMLVWIAFMSIHWRLTPGEFGRFCFQSHDLHRQTVDLLAPLFLIGDQLVAVLLTVLEEAGCSSTCFFQAVT